VDQQATRRPGIQSGATIYPSCLKGSQGVTPFLKVTAAGRDAERSTCSRTPQMLLDVRHNSTVSIGPG